MKANSTKKNQSQPKNPNHKPHHTESEASLEHVAEELTRLALRRLPKGVLEGALSGHEDDIRQEAILLALTWYLRGVSPDPDQPVEAWHAPRAIAGALRIIKRDTLKSLLGESEQQQELQAQARWSVHPVMIRSCEWPTDVMRDCCKQAIRMALHESLISPLAAAVAEAVYLDGIHVSDLAGRLGVHRSNIYQHLTRSRPHIQDAIKRLEVSLDQISSTSSLTQ